MSARSKAWVCGRLLAGIVGSNHGRCLVVCCECCLLFGSGLCGRLITRPVEPTQCTVYLSESDREASTVRRPWRNTGCRNIGEKLGRKLRDYY
jgi:hypothetical protein